MGSLRPRGCRRRVLCLQPAALREATRYPFLTLQNLSELCQQRWQVAMGRCPFWPFGADVMAGLFPVGTQDRVNLPFYDTTTFINVSIQTANSSRRLESMPPSSCSAVNSKPKLRVTTHSLTTTLLSIVFDNPCLLFRQSQRGGGDTQLAGWRPDPGFFGQRKRSQMPSPTSFHRRGVKVFAGTSSTGFRRESDQWCVSTEHHCCYDLYLSQQLQTE